MKRRQRLQTPTGATKPDGSVRPYLNDAAIVDRLIRDFTCEALGLVGREDFMARLDFECRRINSLFLGGPAPTDRYERGLWNTPDQLGEYVLKALQITGETRLAVRDAFTVYFSSVLDLAEDRGRFDAVAIEPLIADLRGALMGQFAPRS
ncbi:MAG TPA: hypothetical protein VIH96_24035 [Paraburkholderia sp.]